MSTTISDGTHTITPDVVTGYEATKPSNNVIHQYINGDVSVTLRPDGQRTGTLQLAFALEADVWSAYGYLSAATTFLLSSTDIAAINMNFVRAGAMVIGLDSTTLKAWTLQVPFQEAS